MSDVRTGCPVSAAGSPEGARESIAFDHHDPALVTGFRETWRELAEANPLHWSTAHGGFWIVTSYEAVYRMARDADAFSSAFANGGNTIPAMPFEFGFVNMDPPEATARRRLLAARFAPDEARRWEAEARDVATAFIDRVIEGGRCDLIDDLASPVPAVLTMALIGLPLEHWRLCADANHHMNTAPPGSPLHAQAIVEMAEVEQLLIALIEHHSNATDDDGTLASLLCRATIDGEPVDRAQILNDLRLVLNGGVDTSASLLGSALQWLAEHPDRRAELRDRPELLEPACEEFLRFFTPVTAMARTCVKDNEIEGQLIRAGERVLLAFSSANADPQAFADPENVQLDRWPNRHTSFGLGPHRCLGSHFARAEFKITLEEVLKRMPDYAIDATATEQYPSFGVNQGWISLPATFTPSARLGSTFTP
jgi:cytochrome P450